MVEILNTIKGFDISFHNKSQRIINISIKEDIIEKLIFPFNKFDIIALEYKPFTRFTLAKSLDDITQNKLGLFLQKIIKNRKTGCFILSVANVNKKITNDFLVKLSTAIGHLLGVPNHDAMSGNYYARFHVKHEDNSDSYLRKAYKNMDLHTDGTYVDEKTDWFIMTKLEEKTAEGGETSVLHLDDLENLNQLLKDPVGKEDFMWRSPKSKNINYKVKHPIFTEDENGLPNISYIDQFPEPKNMKQ